MLQRQLSFIIVFVACALAGCSVILGPEESAPGDAGGISLRYVETLRSQASLAGASYRESDPAAGPATSLQRPAAVAADPFRVFVAERSPLARIAVFDRGNQTLTFITGPTPTSPSIPQFIEPAAVTIDESGIFYVADRQLGRVFGMDRKGTLVASIGQRGELSTPAGIAVDAPRARLFIADTHAGAVKVFSLLGDHLFDIRGSGRKDDLRQPVALAVDREGACYVLDDHRRVHVYGPSGAWSRSFAVLQSGDGPAPRPAGIALDSRGRVFVLDSQNSTLSIHAADGALLKKWGSTGTGRDELWNPLGIFIDSRDVLYIADQMNGRIQVYQYDK